jgi:hypothetical protein
VAAENPTALVQALPVASFAAVLAGATRADAGDEDAVAGREPVHAVADLVDGAHGLVAEDPPGVHLRDVAREDVQVGPADGCRVNPDDGVALVEDLRVGNLFPCLLAGAVVNERVHGCLRMLSFCLAVGLSLAPRSSRQQGPKVPGCGPKV